MGMDTFHMACHLHRVDAHRGHTTTTLTISRPDGVAGTQSPTAGATSVGSYPQKYLTAAARTLNTRPAHRTLGPRRPGISAPKQWARRQTLGQKKKDRSRPQRWGMVDMTASLTSYRGLGPGRGSGIDKIAGRLATIA